MQKKKKKKSTRFSPKNLRFFGFLKAAIIYIYIEINLLSLKMNKDKTSVVKPNRNQQDRDACDRQQVPKELIIYPQIKLSLCPLLVIYNLQPMCTIRKKNQLIP